MHRQKMVLQEKVAMVTNYFTKTLNRALARLRHERERLQKAIEKIEDSLPSAPTPSRGEMATLVGQAHRNKGRHATLPAKPRSRQGWTPAARHAASLRMRAYWATLAAGDAPPRAKKSNKSTSTKTKARRSTTGWTPKARKQASIRMQKLWADKRAQS